MVTYSKYGTIDNYGKLSHPGLNVPLYPPNAGII